MKRCIPVFCLALFTPAALVAGVEKAPAPAAAGVAKNGPVLDVAALMRDGDKHKGPLRVQGVVSRVFAKEQKLGLIDAAEFKRCGGVTCADMVLPVQWNGAMPEAKSLIRLEGEIRMTGEKLEFVARSLEKVPAKRPAPFVF